MEDNEIVVYEAKGFVDGYDEPMYAVFETQEMAELWLSDFYDGAYHRMVIEDIPEPDCGEIARFFDSIDLEEYPEKPQEN
jgi:hypothetical protein